MGGTDLNTPSIIEATEVSIELAQAYKRLLPQLSESTTLPDDLDEIIEILNKIIEPENSHLFIAKVGQEIVGFIFHIEFDAPAGERWFSQDLVVDINHRKNGIGSELIKQITERAEEKRPRTLSGTSGTDTSEVRLALGQDWETHKTNYFTYTPEPSKEISDAAPETVLIEEATEVTEPLALVYQRLLPQLSKSALIPDDLAEIQRILNKIIEQENSHLFIARVDDEIVGFIFHVEYDAPTGNFWYCEDLVVDSAYRGKGIGAALLNTVTQKADIEGPVLVACTSRADRKTQHLFETQGWENRPENVYVRFKP